MLSILIGSVKLILYTLQNFTYEFQAELCFLHVLLVLEFTIRFSNFVIRSSVSGVRSVLLSINLFRIVLFSGLNFRSLSSPKLLSAGSGSKRVLFFGIL